ncbi:MAG: tyrosine--tRNA ligase [Chlorobiota bacterium]|jgi:tyrosyl-tRNA synthetase|nr:MAG: tyrosine--tRNA ligase [Chlorobiota bacterium]
MLSNVPGAMLPAEEQFRILSDGVAEILPLDEFRAKLERAVRTRTPLRVKLGCDPSRPDLHIGHAVVLEKLRQFQELGHTVIFIIGDFTAMIGDPSGRSKTRPALTLEETQANARSYFEQVGIVLDLARAEIHSNSEWLSRLTFADVIRVAAQVTVSQMLERDDFHQRFNSEQPIALHELLYPLAQGLDSVEVRADIELGGTDQRFNFLLARELQKHAGQEPQAIVLMPLLEGTDGVQKMSKSLGNYIALLDPPREMFGKVMSIPDELIVRYYRYATFASADDARAMEQQLRDGRLHPRDAKALVAERLVTRYHGEDAARYAREEFDRMFRHKEVPEEIETVPLQLPMPLVEVVVAAGLVPSKSEARRLIAQGGIYVNGERVTDYAAVLARGEHIVKVGKRRFVRIQSV